MPTELGCSNWSMLCTQAHTSVKQDRKSCGNVPVMRHPTPDDLDLGLDDESVGDCEALQHLVQLHKFLPSPVMLLLTESVQGVCSRKPGDTRLCLYEGGREKAG